MGLKEAFKSTAMDIGHNPISGTASALKDASRGQIRGVDALVPLALAIVSLAIVVGIGVIVLANLDDAINNTDASSVLTTAISAMQTFADFFVVIIVIGIAAVIFLLLRAVRGAGAAASS